LSKILRKDYESTADIRLFALQEVSATGLYHQGSVFTVPKVIRDTTDCPYPIKDYPLFRVGDEPPEVRDRVLHASDPDEGAADLPAAEMPTVPSAITVQPEEDLQQAAALLLQQAQEEAERYLARAKEEAAHCLAQAQAQATALTQEAYEHGLRQGEAAAREEVAEQCATLFTSLQQATEALARVRTEALSLAEEDILTLALQLAQKIVHCEVSSHRQVLATTLQRALAYQVDGDRIVIRVNPADLAQAQELQPRLMDSGEINATCSMRGDESIGRGGCVVDSEFGSIDARIDAQFAELEQHLRAHLSQEGIV
jgi:flagellar biosynthesis/type III secretory pathway protein FliH